MRALTIRQPWAAAITYADKRVENRVWPTSYRGYLEVQLDSCHVCLGRRPLV